MPLTEPWSKKHKAVTNVSSGGLPYSLSNSYAQPLTMPELAAFTVARGDRALLDEYRGHALGYTPNGGSLDLRSAIAGMYGPGITPAHVLVFAGAQVALQTASLALATGCHAIVFAPGYQSTVAAPGHAGAEVTEIRLRADKGWQIDPAEVEAAVRPGETRYMVINEPYNPAGTLMSREVQAALVAIAKKHGITLMSDEVYRLLEHDEADRLPAMADAYERGISAVTMSKPWGGCGITIGWLAFADLAVKQRLVDVQYFGTACPGRATELQAMMVLRASDAILAKNLAIIRRNVEKLREFMNKYEEYFAWVPPRAGAVAFLKFKGGLTSEQLGQEMAAAGIGMKPAYCFTPEVTDDVDFFRVGYGEEVMPEALDKFAEFVEANKHRWQIKDRSR